MITANELRKNNLLYFLFKNGEIVDKKVTRLTTSQIDKIDRTDNVSDFWEPIPLTPEILESCGFKFTQYNWYVKEYFTDCKEVAEVMSIQINLTTGRCGIGDTDFGGCNAMTGKIIQHLHQLQNLIYALTGQELEVKL